MNKIRIKIYKKMKYRLKLKIKRINKKIKINEIN